MENNEIVETTEEVMEDTAVAVVEECSKNGFNTAVGVGLGMIAGVLIHRFIIMPIAQRMKAKKEAKTETYENCGEVYTGDVDAIDDTEDETEDDTEE